MHLMQSSPVQQFSKRSLLLVEYLAAQNPSRIRLPLVLIHGWGNSSTCWQPLLPELNREHELYLVDLPACGNNTFNTAFSFDELLQELEDILPASSVLIGWSLGGMLASRLAAQSRKKIPALITLATNAVFVAKEGWPWAMDATTFATFVESFRQNPQAGFKKFTALQVLGDDNSQSLRMQLAQLAKAPSTEQALSWLRLLELLGEIDNRQVSHSLSCPGLHVFAENDVLVPVAVVEHLYAHTGQRTKIFPACAHALHLSRPTELNQEIINFLEELELENSRREHKQRVARAFSQAASTYDKTAGLQRQVAERLLGLCDFALQPTASVLDLGCGTGFVSEMLQKNQPVSSLVLVDLSQAMLKCAQEKLSLAAKSAARITAAKATATKATATFVTADMDRLPFAPGSLDLVVSSMSVQWSVDTEQLFAQVYSCLKPGGRFLLATVGETTLHELAQAWRQVDDYVHVNRFLSQADIQACVGRQHFFCEQTLTEIHIQYFADVIELMKSLKAVGAHTVNTGNNHGLTSRARLQALQTAYETFRAEDGTLPASWEIMYFVLRK